MCRGYGPVERVEASSVEAGVEARVESLSPFRKTDGFYSSHSTTARSGYTAVDTVRVGGRRFEIIEPEVESEGWPPATQLF